MSDMRERGAEAFIKWYSKNFHSFGRLPPRKALRIYAAAFNAGFKDGHTIGQVAGRTHEANRKKE